MSGDGRHVGTASQIIYRIETGVLVASTIACPTAIATTRSTAASS